jgi:hypothetical protein
MQPFSIPFPPPLFVYSPRNLSFTHPSQHTSYKKAHPNPFKKLPHLLQEIVLLDLTPPLVAHGLGQLRARRQRLLGALERAVSRGQVDGLFVEGDFGLEEARVEELLLAEGFGGDAALFFGFGCCGRRK